MSHRSLRVATAAAFATAVLGVCTSCTTSKVAATRQGAASAPESRVRWEQVAYGSEAQFVACTVCPKVTPKTLYSSVPAGAPAPSAAVSQATPSALVPLPASTATAAVVEAFPPAPVPVSPDRKVERTADIVITFPLGSAQLNDRARAQISKALKSARLAQRIVIAGRTDDSGGDRLNETLALARAVAVRNYFRDIAPNLPATFVIRAKGRCCFVATNTDEAGRSMNRRVEVQFSAQGGA